MNDACERAAVDDERGRNRPAGVARNEGASAVDRINDEQGASLEALSIVGRFFRQPPRLRKRLQQASLQQGVGGEIGLRHRRPADLG